MTDLSADLALADSEARASRARASDLRAAAQAVVDRWDTPLWKDVPATGEYINALRSALSAPAVPPGWKLVPVEPTNAMWDSAVLEENRISRDFPGQHPSCFQIWKSMVSAASSAKEPTCPKN